MRSMPAAYRFAPPPMAAEAFGVPCCWRMGGLGRAVGLGPALSSAKVFLLGCRLSDLALCGSGVPRGLARETVSGLPLAMEPRPRQLVRPGCGWSHGPTLMLCSDLSSERHGGAVPFVQGNRHGIRLSRQDDLCCEDEDIGHHRNVPLGASG